MSDPQVLEALKLKISRERVGIELEKMLRGLLLLSEIPLVALAHTVSQETTQWRLWHSSIGWISITPSSRIPPALTCPTPDISNWTAVYSCLDILAKTKTPGSIYDQLVRGEEARYFAWVLAALYPCEQVADLPNPKAGKPGISMAYLAAGKASRPPISCVTLSSLLVGTARPLLS